MPDQLTEGLIDPRRRRPMPPPVGGGFTPPEAAPIAPRQPDPMEQAARRVQEQAEASRQLATQQPAPAKGLRAGLGTAAAVLGSLVNPQIGNILSQKLLHPGREKWQQEMDRAEEIQKINEGELRGLEGMARIQDLRQNRADINTDRDAARVDARRNAAIGEEGRLRTLGAEDAPDDIRAQLSSKLLDPMNPRTRVIPGLSTEQQVSPDVGTVKTVEGGGYQNKLVLPTAGAKQRRKLVERKAEKEVDRESAQADWVPVTEEIAKRFPALGLKVGEKVAPERLDKLALHKDEKDEDSPSRVLINPGKYTPEQVAAAKKLWGDQHREPTGGGGAFQALVNETGEITGFYNPKTKEFSPSPTDGARKTPLPPTEMVRRANLQDTIENLARLEELAPKYKDKIGAIKGRLADAELQTIGNDNPEIAELYRISQDLTDQLLRERSGAAISEKEYGRLSRLVPNISQPYSTFWSNLKSYQKERARLASNSTGGKLGGAAPAAPASTPTVKTKAEYDALPSGTVYLEDGKKFRKP